MDSWMVGGRYGVDDGRMNGPYSAIPHIAASPDLGWRFAGSGSWNGWMAHGWWGLFFDATLVWHQRQPVFLLVCITVLDKAHVCFHVNIFSVYGFNCADCLCVVGCR